MPHVTCCHPVRDRRRRELLASAARGYQVVIIVVSALLHPARALLVASIIASTVSQATVPVSNAETPLATEEILMISAYAYRPAGSVRTVAQVMIPAGAHWETEVSTGSVMLTVASGVAQVVVSDGAARILHPSGAETRSELTLGTSEMLFARDRLIMRGGGSLLMENIGQDPVIAAVARVS